MNVQALDAIRLREYSRGWNDAQAGRDYSARADNALAYLAGYASGQRTTEGEE